MQNSVPHKLSTCQHQNLCQNSATMNIQKKPTILVTGATGFIGRRLVKELLQRDYRVRCMVRRPSALPAEAEQVQADLLKPDSLPAVLNGIDTVYYLVHSMGQTKGDFAEQDRQAARNFVAAANLAGVKRVIYLGGLGRPAITFPTTWQAALRWLIFCKPAVSAPPSCGLQSLSAMVAHPTRWCIVW